MYTTMRRWLLPCALALLALGGQAAHAQPQRGPVSIRQVNDSGGTLITVANVVDSAGRPVQGIPADAFQLQLDGAPVPVGEVRFTADLQTGVGLVLGIDTSGSMAGERLARAKAAAGTLLDILQPADQVALLVFNTQVAFFSDFTSDRAALKAAVNRLNAGGDTALYSAVVAASSKAATAPLPRKTVVLLTDGENFEPAGRTTRENALDAARASGVPVYSVGLGSETDQAFLDELAQVSRGQTQNAPGPADLDRLFRGIGEALRGQYVLRAQPPAVRRASSHSLRLTVRLNGASVADEVAFPGTGLPLLPDPTVQPTAAPAATPAPAATAPPLPTAAPVSVPVAEEAPSDSGADGAVALGAGALVLLAAAGGGSLWLVRRRRERSRDEAAPVFEPAEPPPPVPAPPGVPLLAAAPATLDLRGGPLAGLQVPVAGEPVTIGTAHDCTVVLPEGTDVERRHARIWQRDGRYMLHRLARGGAIQMAGQPLQWAVLEHDDEFSIGPHQFRFQINGAVGAKQWQTTATR